MVNEWQLQHAKNKLSELIDCALEDGPQHISRHGKATVVVLSVSDFDRLTNREESIAEFFQRSPLRGMTFEHSKDLPREVEL